MKINISIFALILGSSFLLQGCASTNSKIRSAKNLDEYCYARDGEIKTVHGGEELYCLLPSGEVIDLKEYFEKHY